MEVLPPTADAVRLALVTPGGGSAQAARLSRPRSRQGDCRALRTGQRPALGNDPQKHVGS